MDMDNVPRTKLHAGFSKGIQMLGGLTLSRWTKNPWGARTSGGDKRDQNEAKNAILGRGQD
jgi:hypothetical protein